MFSNDHRSPKRIALDDEFVYWTVLGHCKLSVSGEDTGSGHLVRAHRANGSQSIDIEDLPCPVGVAVEGDDVYITNQPGAIGGSIWTAKTNGESVRVLVDDLYDPSTVQADATHVYFFDGEGIYRVAREGGGGPELVGSAERVDTGTVNAFVLDDDFVYWIDRGFQHPGIVRAPKAGGERELVAPARDALEIASSEAGLFWVDETDFDRYAVMFLAWGGEMPIPIATPSERPSSLSAVEEQAFWVDYGYPIGAVHGATASTGESVFFMPEEPVPTSVTVDRDYVFWTTSGSAEEGLSGQVMRACRPKSR